MTHTIEYNTDIMTVHGHKVPSYSECINDTLFIDCTHVKHDNECGIIFNFACDGFHELNDIDYDNITTCQNVLRFWLMTEYY